MIFSLLSHVIHSTACFRADNVVRLKLTIQPLRTLPNKGSLSLLLSPQHVVSMTQGKRAFLELYAQFATM
jgi:hypothetical protein